MSIADPNKVILTGENPFIRMSPTDGAPETTSASFWRIILSPAGPGHVLYMKSELTDGAWRIWSDNIAMTRWLQDTVQGMLNAELKDTSIPVTPARFRQYGTVATEWTESLKAHGEELALTWFNAGDPLLLHAKPNEVPGRHYGLCTVLIPVAGTRVTLNGRQAGGKSWPREREGRPFSTSALAFSESWTDVR